MGLCQHQLIPTTGQAVPRGTRERTPSAPGDRVPNQCTDRYEGRAQIHNQQTATLRGPLWAPNASGRGAGPDQSQGTEHRKPATLSLWISLAPTLPTSPDPVGAWLTLATSPKGGHTHTAQPQDPPPARCSSWLWPGGNPVWTAGVLSQTSVPGLWRSTLLPSLHWQHGYSLSRWPIWLCSTAGR